MKQVSEYEILTAISNVAVAIGAMDTVRVHTYSCRLYGPRRYKKPSDLIGDES